MRITICGDFKDHIYMYFLFIEMTKWCAIRNAAGLLFNEIRKSNAINRTSHQSEINVVRERGTVYSYTVTVKWSGYIINMTIYIHSSKLLLCEQNMFLTLTMKYVVSIIKRRIAFYCKVLVRFSHAYYKVGKKYRHLWRTRVRRIICNL